MVLILTAGEAIRLTERLELKQNPNKTFRVPLIDRVQSNFAALMIFTLHGQMN